MSAAIKMYFMRQQSNKKDYLLETLEKIIISRYHNIIKGIMHSFYSNSLAVTATNFNKLPLIMERKINDNANS